MADERKQINDYTTGSTLADTTNILGQTVDGKTEKYPISSIKNNYLTSTYANIITVISDGSLIPYRYYYISDKNIMIQAKSTTEFFPNGYYYYSTGRKAFGVINLTGGSSGSVDMITVDGVNILGNPVSYTATHTSARVDPGVAVLPAYDTSLNTLASTCASVINSNASNTLYTAYAVANFIVIEAKEKKAITTEVVLSATTTTITFEVEQNVSGGMADLASPYILECGYDVNNDTLTSLYDKENNNFIYQSKDFQDTYGNSLLNFTYNDSRVKNCKIINCKIYPNFIYSNGYIDNIIMNEGEYGNNIVVGYLQNVNFDRGLFLNNYMTVVYGIMGNGSAGTAELYQPYYASFCDNVTTLTGKITGVYLEEGAWFNGNYVNRVISENRIGNVGSICGCKFVGGVFANNWFWHRFQMVNVSIDGRVYNNIWQDDGFFAGLILNNATWIFGCIIDNIGTFKQGDALISPLTTYTWSNVKIMRSWISDSYMWSNLTNVCMTGVKTEHMQFIDKTLNDISISGEKSWLGHSSFTIEIKMDGTNNGAANSKKKYGILWDNEVIKRCEVAGYNLVSSGNTTIGIVGGTEGISTTMDAVNNRLVDSGVSQLVSGIAGSYTNSTKTIATSGHNLTSASVGLKVKMIDVTNNTHVKSTTIASVTSTNIVLTDAYGGDLGSVILVSDIENIKNTNLASLDNELAISIGSTAITSGYLQIRLELFRHGKGLNDLVNNW